MKLFKLFWIINGKPVETSLSMLDAKALKQVAIKLLDQDEMLASQVDGIKIIESERIK